MSGLPTPPADDFLPRLPAVTKYHHGDFADYVELHYAEQRAEGGC